MAKNIQIVKQSTIELPGISSYKLVVSAINAQNMSDKVFVKQRIRNFAKNTIDDTFVAVCTPAQLEDFEEDAPAEGTSYFRANTIELISRTPEHLVEVFDSLIYEVKKLVVDLTDLENLSQAEIYNISADSAVALVGTSPVVTSIFRNNSAQSITVNFTPGGAIPGYSVIDYQYSLDGGNTWKDRLPRSTSSPLVIYGLDNETIYNLAIRGYMGGIKYGPASTSLAVNIVAPPTAPSITAITPGNTQLSIAFTAPENVIISNYEYSVNNGATWITRTPASAQSPLVVTSLLNGTTYTVKIRGINSSGYGVSSVSAAGTPTAPAPPSP